MAIQDLKVSTIYSGRDISSLSDRPNEDGISAANLKARFDQLNKEVIPNYNDLIDLLDAYIQTNDGDIVALENAINGLGISLGDLDLSVTEVLDAYNSGVLSGVYTGTTEPTDPRIKVWIDTDGQGIVIDETNRVNQEIVRQSNENTRITNDNTRISNENTRISQESSRVTQENARNVFVAYNPSTPYVVGNKVSYLGSSYVCILNSTGNLPTNTTYWLLMASKGDNTTADAVANTPSGNISSTNVQGAINELDTEKADKLFATNLVTNGDFSNGTTGWTGVNATISVASNELTMLASAATGNANQLISPSTIVGHVYLLSMSVKSTSNQVGIIFGSTGGTNLKYHTGGNTYEILSILHTATTTNHSFRLIDKRTSGWDNVYGKYCKVIDLTATFGAGKEPTKEQVDWVLAQKYTNSWFNGTQELTSITDLLTFVNTKADKTQEAWITPTLLNGWTGTLKYRKNNFGQLEFWADLIAGVGTFDTEIFTFPSTYRTGLFMSLIRGYNSNAGASPVDLRINLTGKLAPVSTITTGHRILFNAVIQIS